MLFFYVEKNVLQKFLTFFNKIIFVFVILTFKVLTNGYLTVPLVSNNQPLLYSVYQLPSRYLAMVMIGQDFIIEINTPLPLNFDWTSTNQ